MCALFLFNLHLDAKAASLGLTLCPLSKTRFQRRASIPAKSRKCCIRGIDVFVGEIHLRVTISVKWQQCSPDHCLRDDIFLNSISFSSLSSHVQSVTAPFPLCDAPICSYFLLYAPKYLPPLTCFFFPHLVPDVIPFHVITFCLCDMCHIHRL